MKNWKQGFIGLLVIFAIAFATCKDDPPDDMPVVLQPTSRDVSFGKITVSSSDQRTPSEWNTVLGNLVSTLNTRYENATVPALYETVFVASNNIQIVLVNDLSKNWEVKPGASKGTLYIKTDSISSIDVANYEKAVLSVSMNVSDISLTKATPMKNGVFFLLWDKTFSVNIG